MRKGDFGSLATPDTIIWYDCWFCGAAVDHSTQMAQTRVWLATLSAVAAGHLDEMHGDYGENVCPPCAERLVGPNWPTVALAWADYLGQETVA